MTSVAGVKEQNLLSSRASPGAIGVRTLLLEAGGAPRRACLRVSAVGACDRGFALIDLPCLPLCRDAVEDHQFGELLSNGALRQCARYVRLYPYQSEDGIPKVPQRTFH